MTQHRALTVPAMRPGRRTAPSSARWPLSPYGRPANTRLGQDGWLAGSPDGVGAGFVQSIGHHGGSPISVLDAFLVAPFLDGRQPFARSRRLDSVREEATLRPAGTEPARSVVSSGRTGQLVTGDGWTLLSVRWPEGGANVQVVAASDDLAQTVLASAVEGAAAELAADDPRVEIGFWHLTGSGAHRRELPIAAEPWEQIRRNYPAVAAEAFDRLVTLDGGEINGRILLVHGPPGTGKTTALRSLAKQWQAWCQLDFVLDPDRLFASPGYLIEVIMGDDDDDKPWRMLLLEDCDELIRPGAKASAGQALSRLLNLTDGLLGQGRQVLVAITTNEDIARLHPAVTRPGRCLAQIEVGRLPYDQAVAWLGDSEAGRRVPTSGATLAELIALRDGTMPVGTPEGERSTGLYL